PAFTAGLIGKPNEIKLKYLADNDLAGLSGEEAVEAMKNIIRNKENDMLKYKNFGRKSLVELNEVLTSMGLNFGMDVDEYLKD
ncbi:MAG: DNA-directed RNA polymerase subunit alpha C-terminal domain-containing protein, partial [Fibrobacteraceae bacterium]|nr:DNA-directed RNA polymerase subunit alpha C-terminal domain-containing protein [Fibrobacteraceae bacterium]